MKLRRKTFAIISIAVVSLVGTLLVVAQTMMMGNVVEMEQKTTSQGINRVLDALSQDLAQLNSTTQDYAAWDDTYAFVQDGNTSYINLNLMDATFVNLRLNLMLFINTSDQVVFAKAYDLDNMTDVPVPQSLLSHLAANDTLLHHESLNSSTVGTLLLPEGPILVASSPILTSLGQGPIQGTLVTGRFLDSTELNFLFQTTRLPLVVQTIADSPISSDFQTANSSLSKKSPVFVQPLSTEKIAGYALLEDVYGTPILILRTDMPRDFYAQSQTGILTAALFLIVIGVTFGLLTMLILEKLVVSRLTRLSTDVSEISKTGDLSVRVPETGKDELSSLGEGINRMLSALGQTQERRALSERELLIKDNAIASSIDGMAISNLQGNITYVNPVFVKMWGYDSDKEVLGKSIAEMTRKGQSKEKADEIVKALETKGGWTGEITATRKDGSKFYSILSASLVKDETGKPICMLGSFVDVTERKKGEEALKESEERLRQLIEYAPDAIYTNDLQGNFLEGNKQAENLIGFKKEELVGKNILEIGVLPRKYAPKVMQDLMRNLQGQRSGPDEYELIRKDGTSVTAEISTFPIRREGKVEVIGIARDITERKQTDKKLRESEEKLRNIIESSPDAIIITNLKGNIIDCNQAAVSLGGYSSKEELMGKSAFDLMAKRDHQRAMENYKITAEKGFLRNIPYTLIKKDGHEYPTELSASALKDASGNPVGFVAVVRDVTERKQMQEKLEEYSQQLEKMVEQRTKQLKNTQEQLVKSERLATIGQVAAMVGHDLRNPLTGISGAAYYLKMKLGPNAEKKMLEMLEIIEKDIQYSSNIITDLMEYSREIKLDLTETTPKSIIAESISLVQIPEKVQLADSTLNEPRIKMDFDKMKRVFANFIKNAVEAMPQGGKLAISSRASKSNVELTFVDTGIGMAKEVLEKIWTPFFTTKAKGMGLGLAICRRIIEAHRGKISVESIVGVGTTFTITIPIESKPRAEGGEKVWVNMPESLLSMTTKA